MRPRFRTVAAPVRPAPRPGRQAPQPWRKWGTTFLVCSLGSPPSANSLSSWDVGCVSTAASFPHPGCGLELDGRFYDSFVRLETIDGDVSGFISSSGSLSPL